LEFRNSRKKEKEEKKIPIPTSPKRSTKDLFKALFFNTPWSEPEEECQHQTPRRTEKKSQYSTAHWC